MKLLNGYLFQRPWHKLWAAVMFEAGLAASCLGSLLSCLVVFYQRVVIKPAVCRYYPTCSHYAIGALRNLNPSLALYMIARRILRCHPYSYHARIDEPPTSFYECCERDGILSCVCASVRHASCLARGGSGRK